MAKSRMTAVNRSLPFAKFRKALEAETRAFWHVLASLEYATRWWDSIPHRPVRLSRYSGDDRTPFRQIDIPVDEYLSNCAQVRTFIRENAVVSIVTAFEFYLFELLERLIYLDPMLIGDSSMKIEAKELAAAVPRGDVRRWFATRVADNYIRNKNHAEMISKIAKFSKAGISARLKDKIDEWNKWSFVRNAIVHTSRFVTSDLAQIWPARFTRLGSALELSDQEVGRVQYLALLIAREIDKRAVASTIGKKDAYVLVRELFVQKGIDDVKELRRRIVECLSTILSVADISHVIAQQRKGLFLDTWVLDPGDLEELIG